MSHSVKRHRSLSSIAVMLLAILLVVSGGPVQANRPAGCPVASQFTAWNALPNQGLSGDVHVLAVFGDDLYVGGDFTQTDDGALTNLGNMARYDTAGETWSALPNRGLSGQVSALAVVGSDLYVGGHFSQTGDGTLTNLGNIARYDTATETWSTLSSQGLDNTVLDLAVSGNDLYVGGYFRDTGDETLTDLGCIARYDTATATWNTLPNQGLGGGAWPMPSAGVLLVVNGDLYVGGNFSRTGDGTLTNLSRIARYDTVGRTWNGLPDRGLNDDVDALAVVGSDLYVGGSFTRTRDGALTSLGRIARYDTSAETWHTLSSQGLDEPVYALKVCGDDLYVGGRLTRTGDRSLTDLGRIARYDTASESWNALPNQGFDDWVRALAVCSDDLYVGGDFTQTGDALLSNLGCIARGGTSHATPTPTSSPSPVRLFLPLVLKAHS